MEFLLMIQTFSRIILFKKIWAKQTAQRLRLVLSWHLCCIDCRNIPQFYSCTDLKCKARNLHSKLQILLNILNIDLSPANTPDNSCHKKCSWNLNKIIFTIKIISSLASRTKIRWSTLVAQTYTRITDTLI
jgi:hypothetical protein